MVVCRVDTGWHGARDFSKNRERVVEWSGVKWSGVRGGKSNGGEVKLIRREGLDRESTKGWRDRCR